jgi:hypothetical protein
MDEVAFDHSCGMCCWHCVVRSKQSSTGLRRSTLSKGKSLALCLESWTFHTFLYRKLSDIVQQAAIFCRRGIVSRFLQQGCDKGAIEMVKENLKAAISNFNVRLFPLLMKNFIPHTRAMIGASWNEHHAWSQQDVAPNRFARIYFFIATYWLPSQRVSHSKLCRVCLPTNSPKITVSKPAVRRRLKILWGGLKIQMICVSSGFMVRLE